MQFSPFKIVMFILAGLVLAALTAGLLFGIDKLAAKLKPQPINHQNQEQQARPNVPIPNLKLSLEGQDEGKINMLLLGISGEDYISGELADTIIFASFNTEEHKIDMFSIPRDLWVKTPQGTPEGEFLKINEFYKLGGGTEKPNVKNAAVIKSKISEITGQHIHYAAVINLAGIEEIVDVLGGITIEGQELNGEQALNYIRDRSTPGGDFDRIKRQQKLIIAILQKGSSAEILNGNFAQMLEIYTGVEKHFSTDIALTQLANLNSLLDDVELENTGFYSIVPSTGLVYSGTTVVGNLSLYTLHPTAGQTDYTQIHDFITKTLDTNTNE